MSKPAKKTSPRESDNFYFLKILLYFLVGMVWIKLNGFVIFPLGLIIGILAAQHDRFAIDRKIEYAILVVACLVGLSLADLMISLWF